MAFEELVYDLHSIGCVKFGEFTLKSGMKSPFYVDLRIVPSHPAVLKKIAQALAEKARGLQYDVVAGIPYAALPIATAYCLETQKPLIYPRKEVKEYGTKKPVEGEFKKGQTCLVIDDLVTTGGSKFEAIAPLEHEGLKVSDILVVIDREQGGKQQIEAKNYRLHAVLNITEVFQALRKRGSISQEQLVKCLEFVKKNRSV